MIKRRIHDGIVGLVILGGILASEFMHGAWIILPAVIGVLLVQSAFTRFCPVYFVLDKLIRENKT